MTKRDLGGTPKKRTRFTAMLRDKIYAGFYKKIPVQDLMGKTLNGGPAGRAGWRAVLPNEKHEFSTGWRAAQKVGLHYRTGQPAAH